MGRMMVRHASKAVSRSAHGVRMTGSFIQARVEGLLGMGSRHASLAFTEKQLDLGLVDSIGRVGAAYDSNALIESTIGSTKTELINRQRIGWDARQEPETGSARWAACSVVIGCTPKRGTAHPSRQRWPSFRSAAS